MAQPFENWLVSRLKNVSNLVLKSMSQKPQPIIFETHKNWLALVSRCTIVYRFMPIKHLRKIYNIRNALNYLYI